MFFDICVIGGGAAGMMAAITAKMQNKNLKVAIIERLDRVGKKIALTGNGRCNISNNSLSAENYHGSAPQFCAPVFERFSVYDTERFFKSIGITFTSEGNKLYPRSLQAASVVDALRFKADELGVETLLNEKVEGLDKKGDKFYIKTEDNSFTCRSVIVATGLLSGGNKLGCDGNIFTLLKGKGLKSAAVSPAIVQVKTDTDFVRQLKGIKINASVSLMRKNKTLRREYGETLFCDYGLSGPPVLQLSGHAKTGDILSLNLTPDYSFRELQMQLQDRAKKLALRKNEEFLSGFLNKRLGQVVLKRAGFSLSDPVSSLTQNDINDICTALLSFDCTVLGNTGFQNSQVSMGGLYTDQFDEKLMAKSIPGLFAAGEILDITGDCGGYNLQWAWSSGYVAADGAVEYLK